MKAGVAILMLNIPALSGGGGAERFFADFYEKYHQQANPFYNLFFITDESISNLQKINKLHNFQSNIIYFKDYRFAFFNHLTNKISIIKQVSNQLRELYSFFELKKLVIRNNIKLVHIASYTDGSHYFFIKLLNRISQRPKLVLNIVDCRIPEWYYKKDVPDTYRGASAFNFAHLFLTIKLDGVFSWYKNFISFAQANHLIPHQPYYQAIESRFTSLENTEVKNKKKNHIIFAGRLDEQKQPMLFLKAIYHIFQSTPSLLDDWQVMIFGKGLLKDACLEFIENCQLQDKVLMMESNNLAPYFLESKLFVSTQDYENFPSLSMAEAMACGNAIIARNVGQTNYFLEDNLNGFMAKDDGSDLAEKIQTYISSPELHERFSKHSQDLIKNKHNVANFIMQIDAFWKHFI